MTTPFLELENEAWLHLAQAYGAFSKLQQTHPSHQKDFADAIHVCQNILGNRVLQRDYPETYATFSGLGWELQSPDFIRRRNKERVK